MPFSINRSAYLLRRVLRTPSSGSRRSAEAGLPPKIKSGKSVSPQANRIRVIPCRKCRSFADFFIRTSETKKILGYLDKKRAWRVFALQALEIKYVGQLRMST
jgi:hypothetical protein